MEKRFFKYSGPLFDRYFEKPFRKLSKDYIRAAYTRAQAIILIKKAIAADIGMDPDDFIIDSHYLDVINPPKKKIVFNNSNTNPDDDISGIQLSIF